MGAASSLVDENTSNYIKGQAESELKAFSPYYRKQYSVTHFSRVEDELEQDKQKTTQLLKQRDAPEAAEVLYEDMVLQFDETRKWRERYVVVRANHCMECHDSLATFVKGTAPRHILLPTGGTVLTTEEKYMAMVDKCFPDTTNVKEEFAPPLASMPGQFPVYLRLPYRRDYYFCFKQEARQASFLSILSACIRHQNQDFLKRKTCEVQAFLKAIQLYRQEKGKYEAWDMMIGSDVRVMANLVMEQLLPTLEKNLLPSLKAKKTEKKRIWFATVEASYILIQEHLMDGMSSLKKECAAASRQNEVLIHSDMDQIISSRALLEDKLRASVLEPAERFSSEGVQPYLASVLDELMEPISSGFQEGRGLSEALMDELCQDLQANGVTDNLRQQMTQMSRPNLLSCYQKIGSLTDKLTHLQERFGFSDVSSLIHSAQIDLQQLMENAAYTFELMLEKVMQDKPEQAASAMEKGKHRVLKQYDYDSSTARKKLFQDALVAITLPHIKKNLATVCKPELQRLEQSVYADHAPFVHVENVYEGILLQTLDKEVTKVVKEAADLKKHNLLNDSRDLLSQSSRSSLYCSTPSTPGSPARTQTPSATTPSPEPQPGSPSLDPPLVPNGVSPAAPQTSAPAGGALCRGSEGVAAGVAAGIAAAGVAAAGVAAAGVAAAGVAAQAGGEALEEQEVFAAGPSSAAEVKAADAAVERTADEDADRAPDVTTNAAEATDADIAAVTQQVATIALAAAAETTGEEESGQKRTTEESVETPAAPSEPQTPSAAPSQQPEEDVTLVSQEAACAAVESVAETTKEEQNEHTMAPQLEVANEQPAPETEAAAPSGGEEVEAAGGDGQQDDSPPQQSACVESDEASAEPVESGEEEASTTPCEAEEKEVEEMEVEEKEVEVEEKEVVEEKEEGAANMCSDDPQVDASVDSDVENPGSPMALAADGAAGPEAAQTVISAIEVDSLHAVAPKEPVARSDCVLGPMDSIKDIRDLVAEVVDVEDLAQLYPDGVPQDE